MCVMETVKPCVATIGFFDGVHRGHRFLIEQVKELAAKRKLSSTLITFPVHPRKVMQADYQPKLLSTPEEKEELLLQAGADRCVILPFTHELSRLSAYEFMRDVLQKQLNVRILVIGYDHRFGHNRSEGFEDYCRYGEEIGMEVVKARAYVANGVNISSSVIRAFLSEGEIHLANKCLGYRYFLEGTIVDGYKVGRTIGFPTANLSVSNPDKLIPANGVYAVKVHLEGHEYKGMLNIGHRPTLDNGAQRSIEVHILHFSSDIYQKTMRIEFVDRIRDEKKFRRVEELVAQLGRDAELVDRLLACES